MDLALDAAIGGFTLLRQDLANDHGVPGAGQGVQIIVEVKRRSEGAVLSLRGRRPDGAKIVLMRMHPYKAGEEFQTCRRILFGFLENSPIRSESCYDFRVRVGKGVLRISAQQQDK